MKAELSANQISEILAATARFYALMRSSPVPGVRIDLRGKAAGQWQLRGGIELLRFNPEAFLLDWQAHFPATIAHEVAHSLVYRKHGTGKVRPHGPEWKRSMALLGFPPAVTHCTALTGRRTRVYIYKCECGSHPLGPRRHHLVTRRGYRYHCRQCGSPLHFAEQVKWK